MWELVCDCIGQHENLWDSVGKYGNLFSRDCVGKCGNLFVIVLVNVGTCL